MRLVTRCTVFVVRDEVDLHWPYEMIRYWSFVRLEPTDKVGKKRTRWTDEGSKTKGRNDRKFEAGLHYETIDDAEDPILMPADVHVVYSHSYLVNV